MVAERRERLSQGAPLAAKVRIFWKKQSNASKNRYLCNTQRTPMTAEHKLKIEEKVVELLRTVFDPEIPVDIYSLGLIYKIDVKDDGDLDIDMTLTAPNCPAADFIVEDARLKLETIDGIKNVNINIVFEPEWTKDMMSEEAKLELGFL